MFERISELYCYFSDNTEEHEDLPEVKKIQDEYYKFMREYFVGKDFQPVEDLNIASEYQNRKQGFICGFRYGVQLMAECMQRGGTAK